MVSLALFLQLFTQLLIPCPQEHEGEPSLHFTVYTDSVQFRLSEYLVGMHSVYAYEPDRVLAAANFDQWMKEAGISTMRYPGGTIVKYWDWEHPTGVMEGDPWDPTWNPTKNRKPAKWRSLDEYLATVEASRITPMFGVNITSGYQYDRVDESVARAVRMVQYVKKKGHGGAFWYLGNEGRNGGLVSEANLFVQHAKAMKEADPDIKCMFNQNNLTKNYLRRYLKIAGDYIDIAETHGKWPYGGDPKDYEPGTFIEWQTERPLRDRKNHNRAWQTEADSLRKWATEFGRPDLLFANNEYGFGKPNNRLGFNTYTESLLAIDMLQDHFIGNWYMTCYWSAYRKDKGVISKENPSRYNPMKYGFEMLAKAQGADFLKMEDEGYASVYGFAAEKNGQLMIYLINKSNQPREVAIQFDGQRTYKEGQRLSLVSTFDLYGTTISQKVKVKRQSIAQELPALSYSMFTIDPTDK